MHRTLLWSLLLSSLVFAADPKRPAPPSRTPPLPEKVCPPPLTLPARVRECTVDAECTLAGGGCRTCGNFLAVNRRALVEANKDAEDADRKAGCAMTCEACAPDRVELACRAGRCEALPKGR